MIFRRTIISIAALLLVSSRGFGFQVSKSQLQSPLRPAIMPVVHAAPTATFKRSVSHTLASSRVYFPNRRRSVKSPYIKRFTFGGVHPTIVRSHQTSLSGNGGVVTLAVDIGQPVITQSKLIVKNAPPEMAFSNVSWPSLAASLPSGFTLIAGQDGAPEYPILTVTFAIPAGASNIIPIVKMSRFSPLGTIHFAPSEQEVKGVTERVYDAKLYSTQPKVTLLKPETFRALRMVTVSVPLVMSGPQGMEALRQFSVGIRFTSNGTQLQGAVRDPIFADMDARLVANPYDLWRFAVPLRPARTKPSLSGKGAHALSSTSFDSVYNWIDPSAPYIRLAVTRDGLYRVAASELNFSTLRFTISSAGWTPQNLRCINHGKEIPIWIDTDASGNIAAIEFYGQHLRGFPLPTIFNIEYPELPQPQYYNVATDTNVYWLTTSNVTGDSPPLRYAARSLVSSSAPLLSSGTIFLHHERDLNYYKGDALPDETESIQMTEYVPGERFYWVTLDGLLDDSSQSHFTDTFYIAKLPSDTAGKVAQFKFLFRGISDDRNVPFHALNVQVNGGAPILSNPFYDYSFDSLKIAIPLSQLVKGANIVRVNALTANSDGVDQFYLDYYEVSCQTGLLPSIDTGIAKGQWLFSETPGTRTVSLALSDSTPHLYNLTDATRIFPQSGVFDDSTNTLQTLYAAATSASLLKCDNIQPWNTSQTQGWSILKTAHQADYIVITHPEFLRAAGELAAGRSGLGLKTMVITTDEVFNAFDYGSNEPSAIRRFLNYAYYNYSGTPVSFVTLLGDASWDPKFNLSSSTKRSFVPSYGWPVSDYYYSLPGTGDSNLDTQPLMLISRIPASSEASAESYISKLVEYEDEPPASWNRHFLFISGGDSGSQHESFDEAIQSWLLSPSQSQFGALGLIDPPTNIDSTIIERTDFTSGVDGTHVGEIEDALLTGQSIMYFAGHGATFTSDVLLPDASILNNKGLYPLLMTLTCQTGAFAEPDLIGVNESYVDAAEAGSVQAYGTTGFGEEDYDNLLTNYFFQHILSYDSTHDTTRLQSMNMLAMLTAAKLYAWGFGYSGQQTGHNATIQNSMLGDAAAGFVFRPQPEFAVYANEVHAYAGSDTVARISLSLSDSVMRIGALIHNYGYSADRPVVVRFTDYGPIGLPFSQDDTLSRLDTSAIASVSFPLTTQSIGTHQISVVIDPDRAFPESYRPDDSTSIQVRINGLSTTPFYPYEGSRGFCDISSSAVHFIVLTPAGASPGDQVELELDTTDQFSDILVNQKKGIGASYYVTFDVSIPSAPKPWSSVYWWRSRVVRANGDTTDWQYATFSTASAPRSEFSYTSREQDSSTIISGLALDQRGLLYLPTQDTLRLEAISHGLFDSTLGSSNVPFAQVFINDKFFHQWGGGNLFNGFVIVEWTPDGTQIDTSYEFDMHWQNIGNQSFEDSAAIVFNSVLNGIPLNRRVMVLTVGSVQFPTFIDSTESELQSLGSAQGMKPMQYDGSYALIGTKGAAPGTAKEAFAPSGSGGAQAFDTIVTSGTSGLAETPFTAVAKDYGTLSWTGDPIPGGSNITFTVLGARRDGTGIDALDTFNASNGQSFDLSQIDPRIYDQLAVRMNFFRTSNATQSPALSGIELQYDAAPELIFTADSIQTVPNLTNSGGIVMANYGVSTLTCTPADSVPLLLVRQYQGKTDTIALHHLTQLAGYSTVTFSDSVQTTSELGTAALTATVNPNEAQNEQLLFNNTIAGSYTVTRDTMKPSIQILFDDRNISDGGYVSGNTTIQINLLSSNLLRDTSHGSIVAADLVNLNNTNENYQVSYYNYLINEFEQPEFSSLQGGPLQAFLRFKPITPYATGEWLLTAAVTDASGNTDTLQWHFTISNVNGIEEVMNYPNPFKDKTDFTFVLKSDAAADMKIIVYTIAGRKIRTLTPTDLHAGFNMIEWDGRDDNGNEVANGTYLYRVVINGKNGDNVSDAVTERAVRDR